MEFKSGYLTMGMRKIDPAFSWQEILRDRLLFNYSAIASSPRTEDSEQRLSIHPAHVYWYLLAVEAAYRECLVISEITTEVGAPTLTPFDTGGLAQGYFSANVAADPAAKTVADHSFNFSDGLQRFSQWLPLAFDTSNEYWQHPRKPPKLLAAGVRVGDPPSWTWEAGIHRPGLRQTRPSSTNC